MATKSTVLLIVAILLMVLPVSVLGCNGGTETPTSVRGEVNGKLLEEENLLPLKGALVVLAPYRSENEWVLNANFATTTDNDGRFIFSDVEAGAYLVLYDRTGEALATKESWNGKELGSARL